MKTLPDKGKDKFTIVEIGAGSGANFQFYPPNSKVVCIDPNPNYNSYILKRNFDNDGLDIHFEVGKGEDMSGIPDNSVDAVVTTLVMCSVDDMERSLEEIKRILKNVRNTNNFH